MTPEHDPLVGQLLEDRFLVGERLGKGGMGIVYAGEDVHLRRRCALKVLHAAIATNPDAVDRFFREAQAIAQLSHEHIVNVFSLGRGPVVFFAMELLVGEDLEVRLRDATRPVDWREVCAWGVQIARAMAAVHDAGLVHRDLKPSNVFLARRRDGSVTVKLLDFGIVRAEDSELTTTGATLGTPHYMSPEQVRAGPLDPRSDIYAFGILLFRALAGRLPFRGEPFAVAMMQVEVPAPRLTEVVPGLDIPDQLSDLVGVALRKDPSERVASMGAMEAALQTILRDPGPSTMAALADRPETVEAVAEAEVAEVAVAEPPVAPRWGLAEEEPSTHVLRPGAVGTNGSTTMVLRPADVGGSGPSRAKLRSEPQSRAAKADGARDRGRASRSWVVAGVLLVAGVLVAALVASGGRGTTGRSAARAVVTAGDSPRVDAVEVADVQYAGSRDASTVGASPPVGRDEALADGEPTAASPEAAQGDEHSLADGPHGGEPTAEFPVPAPADESSLADGVSASLPAAKEARVPSGTPSRKPSTAAVDPLEGMARRAKRCRKQHGDGSKVVVDYAVATDGTVSRAVPAEKHALGWCLAEVVRATRFAPKLLLGQRVAL